MIATVPNFSAASHFVAENLCSGNVIVVEDQLNRFYNELQFFLNKKDKELTLLYFPGWPNLPYEEKAIDKRILGNRMRFLYKFYSSKNKPVVITDARALFYRTCDLNKLKNDFIPVSNGDSYPMEKFVKALSNYGYERSSKVFEVGEYSLRGGIIDCFIPLYDEPVRIEFFDDQIESIRFFSVDTQISTTKTNQIVLTPANEFKKRFDMGESVWSKENFSFQTPDLFENFSTTFIGDVGFDKLYEALNWRYQNRSDLYLLPPDLISVERKKIDKIKSVASNVIIGPIDSAYFEPDLNGSFSEIVGKIGRLSKRFVLEIVSQNDDELNKTKRLFENFPDIRFSIGALEDNCCIDKKCFISLKRVFRKKIVSKRISAKRHVLFDIDDLVVHKDYGIGRFKGIVRIDDLGQKSDMYKIVYRNEEALYVSVMDASKISKYEGLPPEELDQLGSNAFKIRKKKAYKEIMRMAKRFASIYAKRFISRRLPYDINNPYLFEFEQSFPYPETIDQKEAIQKIKSDLSGEVPMDRLVTGGTGYGKTEIILRAAAIAVFSGRQVLVAAPTTILSNQHYDLFCRRFSDFPINIKRADQLKESDNLDGCDIIIGTQRAARFAGKLRRLSLVIIDEEQRFGVNFKEQFKKTHPSVDFLIVSATPIPRTMQMALSGIWDVSVINSPPAGRMPIETEIRVKSDRVIQDIIVWELRRGGQIYYVHNRIEDIDEVYAKISSLVKDARITTIHGKLTRSQIKNRMKAFRMMNYDLLLSTSIVESGLDIPAVNTIVVDEAENFGLADLYQLRGRVGRSNKSARAVFFVNNIDRLTEGAKKRLSALREFSKGYGSAFDLALNDSRIRGSGNPLGIEQKGKSHFLGFSLYYQMVEEAIAEIKGVNKKSSSAEISWDLPSYIPDYLMSQDEKLIWYQRISDTDSEHIEALLNEATDRYGNLPEAFRNLFFAAKIRNKVAEIGVRKIKFHNRRLLLKFKKNPPVATSSIINIIDKYRGRAGFLGESNLYFKEVGRLMEINEIIDDLKRVI